MAGHNNDDAPGPEIAKEEIILISEAACRATAGQVTKLAWSFTTPAGCAVSTAGPPSSPIEVNGSQKISHFESRKNYIAIHNYMFSTVHFCTDGRGHLVQSAARRLHQAPTEGVRESSLGT